MKKAINLIAAFMACVLLTGCYHDIDLNDYRQEEGENMLVINSLLSPGQQVRAEALRTFFFSDDHHSHDRRVADLKMNLSVNGVSHGLMAYDAKSGMYISDYLPEPGDEIAISTEYDEKIVSSSDVMPFAPVIERITVERQGPMTMDNLTGFLLTYRVTFSDPADEDNYYFLKFTSGSDIPVSNADFSKEQVFQHLAERLRGRIPGWKPNSANGLPFSDEGIDGTHHTLIITEFVVCNNGLNINFADRFLREFYLSAISRDFYEYQVSLIPISEGSDNLQGGLIDLGLAEASKVYSNINNGIGIMGCYNRISEKIDVFKEIGKFPL